MTAIPRHWLDRYGAAAWVLLNLAVVALIVMGSIDHPNYSGQIVYVCVLTAVCSTPLLLLRGWNDRHVLLAILMGMYFLDFGALDLSILVVGSDTRHIRPEFLSPPELAAMLGAVLLLAAYLFGTSLARKEEGAERARAMRGEALPEWSAATQLILGTSLWLIGTGAMIYMQVFAAPEKTAHATGIAQAEMGPVLLFLVMLAHMMQPLGILILSYCYAKRRTVLWTSLIITVVLIEVAAGFIMDVKRVALMGAALVILTRTLVDNRLPKAWILCSVAALSVLFPVFQAYRTEITDERGMDRLQALQELPKVLSIALQSADKEQKRVDPAERPQSFLERSSVKGVLENLFLYVPREVPYLGGQSLVAIPLAFVPRLILPDKEDMSVGLLYSQVILKVHDDLYISISHLGELYWNFGWLGIALGMPIIGTLLGFVGARFNLEHGTSVTRILVLLATAQSLCIEFEGTMPVSYILWLRGMAAIGLLHFMFARRARVTSPAPASLPAAPRFANLMR